MRNAVNDEAIKKILEFDPIAEAEKASGDKEPPLGLTVTLCTGAAKLKHEVFSTMGDTHYRMKQDYFIQILVGLGFLKIFETAIPNDCFGPDQHYIYWQPQYGVFVNFDTYWGDGTVNSAKAYYCWEGRDKRTYHDFVESGHFFRGGKKKVNHPPMGESPSTDVWIGDQDIREGFVFRFNRLRENGKFITPWPERPFLWFLNYGEEQETDIGYKKINEERIKTFPVEAQQCLGKEA